MMMMMMMMMMNRFVAWLTNERRLALFPPGTIGMARREQYVNLRRT